MTTKFYRIVDREPEDSRMSNDGGDYRFGRTVAVEDNKLMAIRYFTSADFAYCPLCGNFDRHSYEECPRLGANESEAEGWESWPEVTDEGRVAFLMLMYETAGGFNPMKSVMRLP